MPRSRFELETVCVLDRRDNQLHHEDCECMISSRSSTDRPDRLGHFSPFLRVTEHVEAPGRAQYEQTQKVEKRIAWSGNRTRVSRVAGENYTTKPTMLASCGPRCGAGYVSLLPSCGTWCAYAYAPVPAPTSSTESRHAVARQRDRARCARTRQRCADQHTSSVEKHQINGSSSTES